jgi:hypothetical protein
MAKKSIRKKAKSTKRKKSTKKSTKKSNSELNKMLSTLEEYHHSPWNSETKTYFKLDDKKITPQSHAGDLLQHSIWTALQIAQWAKEKNNPFIDSDMKPHIKEAIVAGLLHDVAKGGDYGFTCLEKECWFDVYSPIKYEGKGDGEHPVFGGDVLMGKRKFYLNIPSQEEMLLIQGKTKGDPKLIRKVFKSWRKKTNHPTLNIKKLFKELDVSQKRISLMAYMHWEFGRLNLTGNWHYIEKYKNKLKEFDEKSKVGYKKELNELKKELDKNTGITYANMNKILEKLCNHNDKFVNEICSIENKQIENYFTTFYKYCKKVNLKPTRMLLKLCVLVSIADVAAGSTPRIGTTIKKAKICKSNIPFNIEKRICKLTMNKLKPVYKGKDPFHLYKMDENAVRLRNLLLERGSEKGLE